MCIQCLGHNYYLLNECIEMHVIPTISVSRYSIFITRRALKKGEFPLKQRGGGISMLSFFIRKTGGKGGWEFILEWLLC